MVAPNITFRANTETALAAVYDYGTIDTGSTGSTVVWQIWNNWSGSGGYMASGSVASAICSSSTAQELGLSCHDSGSANHTDQTSLPSGSLWVSGSGYIIGQGAIADAVWTRFTGSAARAGQSFSYISPLSGSSGTRIVLVTGNGDGKLSGSADLLGTSGSAWIVSHYISVPNGQAQGTITGAMCLKYKYT